MEKLRKVFEGIWDIKERIVLAAMVLLLCWNVYRVVYPAKTAEPPSHRPPSRDAGDVSVVDASGFEPRQSQDWAAVYTPHPFWYYSGLGKNTDNKKEVKDAGIKLLGVKKVGKKSRAQLQTESAKRWYDEGEKFESFELLKVDPDAQTCEVRSEGLGKVITLQVQ